MIYTRGFLSHGVFTETEAEIKILVLKKVSILIVQKYQSFPIISERIEKDLHEQLNFIPQKNSLV